MSAPASRLFVQLEFTHALGVPSGRYPTGDGDVLMLDVVEGTAAVASRPRRGRGEPSGASAPAGRPVGLALATFVRGTAADAGAELARLRATPAAQQALCAAALATLNRAIAAARAATGDPYALEVTLADARAVRIGCGAPDALLRGEWADAFQPAAPPPRAAPRREQVRVSQEVTEAVQGRLAPYEAEELALRCLLDLQHGRLLAAEAQARAAVAVLRTELGADGGAPPGADEDAAARPLEPAVIEAIARHVLQTAAAHRAARLDALRRPG